MRKVVRRRDQRWKFILPGVFIAIALFSFLAQNFKNLDDEAEAASLANFDPGYIISDYQMGNYNSMTEAEIQAFLKSKNSCNDTNLSRYTYGNKVSYYSETTPYTWHVDGGHFVCMADEVINGETAAHIIYQAAQDFRINPQVLIVVLQKEQAIVTDTFPHSIQYRSAMGYGCPDTAPCSASYAGFKNQVRNAAEMFRTVLDGGWTNYPVGENYIQYNPNAACGGSVVNVKNRATSALYRYTPYQPNAGALAAGYGTATCGAYGNRNFYLYFEDWFGGVMSEGVEWESMKEARVMTVKKQTLVIDAGAHNTINEWLREGSNYYFTKKTTVLWGDRQQVCLQREVDEGTNKCVLMERMSDLDLPYKSVGDAVLMKLKKMDYKYRAGVDDKVQILTMEQNLYIKIAEEIVINGKKYYRTEHDKIRNNNYVIKEDALTDEVFDNFLYPRNMVLVKDSDSVNLSTGEVCKRYASGVIRKFVRKITYDGVTYYQNEEEFGTHCAIRADALGETIYNFENRNIEVAFVDFLYPRDLRTRIEMYTINLENGTTCDEYLNAGDVQRYTTKVTVGDEVFYRSKNNTVKGLVCGVPSSAMREI